MKVNVVCKSLEEVQTQTLVLTVFEDEPENIDKYHTLSDKTKNKLKKLVESKEISGKYKEFTILHVDDAPYQRILVMGLGKKKDVTLERIRSIVSISARNVRRIHLNDMAIAEGFEDLGLDKIETASAIVEGVILGLYRFKKYVTTHKADDKAIKNLTIVVPDEASKELIEKGTQRGIVLSEATNFVRDLVNEPANIMTPTAFANEAEKVAKECGLKIKIIDKEEMKELGMNTILAVNSGSFEPPKVVVLEYNGGGENGKTLGLVGKGVTFDSGGLSLKPADAMFRMHSDMAGAAAVLGAIQAIAKQKLPINVVGVMGLTENLVDAHSYKVGDIIKTMEGKTVEILNTDAEGRLVLADCLTYIRRYKKIDYLVDLATLTGAIIIALGVFASGMMTNNQELADLVKEAGEVSGERVWQLPLYEDYKSQIKSDVADLENSGGRPAGSITAAIFLKEFVGDVPWVHLDIAGTATMDESIMNYAKNPFLPKEGATGVGTRMMYHLAEILINKKLV
ncbi:MAG: putative cytosol aminopeptidase [Candidatus Sericytochromatia bacterium]|nr:MAG: putative cytosol aminopeptidase [Candidatus Sericytochromatia bacterium]